MQGNGATEDVFVAAGAYLSHSTSREARSLDRDE